MSPFVVAVAASANSEFPVRPRLDAAAQSAGVPRRSVLLGVAVGAEPSPFDAQIVMTFSAFLGGCIPGLFALRFIPRRAAAGHDRQGKTDAQPWTDRRSRVPHHLCAHPRSAFLTFMTRH